MCVVCQNVPAVMTGLSGAGLMVRAAIRRSRASRDQAACAQPVAMPASTAVVPSTAAAPHSPTPVGAR